MRLPFLAVSAVLLAACGSTAEAPATADFAADRAALVADDGLAGVRFLPPLAHGGPGGGNADGPLSVRIEAEDGSTVATFDRADLRLDRAAHAFYVNWNTRRSDVGTFTIVVASPAGDLGSIEVELVRGPIGRNERGHGHYHHHHGRGHEGHHRHGDRCDRDDVSVRRAGAVLPIRFQVPEAALDRDGDGVRDWLDACPDVADADPEDTDCDGVTHGGGTGGTTGAGGAGGEAGADGTGGNSGAGGQAGAGGTAGTAGAGGDAGAAGEPGGSGGAPVAPGIRITAPGEAYGHQGDCAGWNGCGDAATCALWACMVNGYSGLVSYGTAAPCTAFDTCHLLDGSTSVQMDWGNFCDVMGVSEIDCAP